MAREDEANSNSYQEYFKKPFVREVLAVDPANKSIFLLHITPDTHYPGAFAEPIGIEKLAGTLVKNEIPLNVSLGVVRNSTGVPLALDVIESEKPDYVGISMPIGALEDAVDVFKGIDVINKARELEGMAAIKVLIGGNLPTNLPADYLALLLNDFPFITVVRGWGDAPLVDLLNADLSQDQTARDRIPGLVWKDGKGDLHVNNLDSRQDYQVAGKPLRLFVNSDSQAFIEGSENCSHPYCTFCARMPYPTKERWSPFDPENVIVQMEDLSKLGVEKATFTDEEALGTTPEHAVEHALPLALAIKEAKRIGRVDANFGFAFSTRSDSIVGLLNAGRIDVLQALKGAGLSRIFLGIESGIPHDFVRWDGLDIPAQGKRYGKGITSAEHLQAIRTLFDQDIELEIGFIPFDPLMDLGEVVENARFLLDNNLAPHTSEVFNKMRLQAGARYPVLMDHVLDRLVKQGQLEEKPNLFKEFNPSTLKVDYDFLHPLVGRIVNLVWDTSRETHWALYALKSYWRSKLITGEPTQGRGFETLTALRNTNLEFLTGVVKASTELLVEQSVDLKDYDVIAPDFQQHQRVQSEVEEYRKRRDNIWAEFLETDMPDYLRQSIVSQFSNIRSL